MAICSNCDYENRDSRAFCKKCGFPLQLKPLKEKDGKSESKLGGYYKKRPPSLVFISVLLILFCGVSGGIIAMYFAVKADFVHGKKEAWEAYKTCKLWIIITLISTPIITAIVLYFSIYANTLKKFFGLF